MVRLLDGTDAVVARRTSSRSTGTARPATRPTSARSRPTPRCAASRGSTTSSSRARPSSTTIVADPFELTNVAGDPGNAATVAALAARLRELRPDWPASPSGAFRRALGAASASKTRSRCSWRLAVGAALVERPPRAADAPGGVARPRTWSLSRAARRASGPTTARRRSAAVHGRRRSRSCSTSIPVTVARVPRASSAATGFETQAERLGASGRLRRRERASGTSSTAPSWRHPRGPATPAAPDDHPVTQVSWNDAQAYCAWAGKRLPDRGRVGARGAQRPERRPRYAWGDELVVGGQFMANTWQGHFPERNTVDDGYLYTSPVGVFGRTPAGSRDMGGNVWQWCADWYRPYAQRDRPFTPDRRERAGDARRLVPLRSEGVPRLPRLGARTHRARHRAHARRLPLRARRGGADVVEPAGRPPTGRSSRCPRGTRTAPSTPTSRRVAATYFVP